MNLRDYVSNRMANENARIKNSKLSFDTPSSVDEIVNLYRTYDGMKRHMRALSPEKVQEYLDKGYAFVGAYYDKELAGIAVSKELPTDYPYFTLPKEEEKGSVFTLGGLYVRSEFQGMGLASKLSRIVTQGTEQYATESNNVVGMAYEVSYDNFGSLRILSQYGNYIGFYSDNTKQEGLTILLYRPYLHDPIKVDRPNIQLTYDEESSLQSLTDGLNYLSQQEQIGGAITTVREVDNAVVTSNILNRTPSTIPETTFEMIK